jgi:hypothetical protein
MRVRMNCNEPRERPASVFDWQGPQCVGALPTIHVKCPYTPIARAKFLTSFGRPALAQCRMKHPRRINTEWRYGYLKPGRGLRSCIAHSDFTKKLQNRALNVIDFVSYDLVFIDNLLREAK